MSTKIFNAYKLVPGADVFACRREVLANLVTPVFQQTVEDVVRDAVFQFDAAHARDAKVTFTDIMRRRLQEFNADNPLRHSSVVVLQNQVRDELYMMCFGNLTHLAEADILALPSVAGEFNYWDNSDGPAHLSAAEWSDRGLAWDEVFGNRHEPVANEGVVIDLFSPYRRELWLDKVAALWEHLAVPTVEQRLDRLAQDLFVAHHLASHQVEQGDLMVEVSRQMRAWSQAELPSTTQASFLTRATLLMEPDLILG